MRAPVLLGATAPESTMDVREIRLLMTVDTRPPLWSWAVELAAALVPLGVHTALAVTGGVPSPAQRARAEAVPGLGLHALGTAAEWMEDPWEEVHRAGQGLLDLEQHLAPDLIHLNSFALGAWPFQAPRLIAAHGCACSQWEAQHTTPMPPSFGRYRLRVCAGLLAAQLLVTPTRCMRDTLARHYGPLPHSRVLPTGLAPPPTSGAAGPRLAIPAATDAGTIGVLGALAGRAGWTLTVVPEEPHPRALEDTGILVSLVPDDPFGRLPLRAAAGGAALILADRPASREVWSEAAQYVSPGEDARLTEIVAGLIADAGRRRGWARAARARFEGRYAIDRIARTWRATYDDLLAAHLPRRGPLSSPAVHAHAS